MEGAEMLPASSTGDFIPVEGYWLFANTTESDWLSLKYLEDYHPSWWTVLVVCAVAIYSAWYYLLFSPHRMILTQYCHRLGSRCDLKAVIAVSSVLDCFLSRESLEETWINSKLYARFLAEHLCDLIRSNPRHLLHEMSKSIDMPRLFRSRSISQFDENLTAPLFGYPSIDDYHRDATNSDKLHKISIPYICLTATDDPFVPEKSIPYKEFEGNPHTLLVTTTSGGHIGFIEGIRPTKATWMNRVCGELLEALKNYEHQQFHNNYYHYT